MKLISKLISPSPRCNVNTWQREAPPWWKVPLLGPAFPTGHKPAPKEMRKPGCNGGVGSVVYVMSRGFKNTWKSYRVHL